MQILKITLTTVLVVCVVIVTALVVRRELFLSRQIAARPSGRVLSDTLWQKVSYDRAALPPTSAQVKLVEFYSMFR